MALSEVRLDCGIQGIGPVTTGPQQPLPPYATAAVSFAFRTSAHLFRAAAAIAFLPAALSFRLGFSGAAFALWYSAHRFF
jgi:hypothetical protein